MSTITISGSISDIVISPVELSEYGDFFATLATTEIGKEDNKITLNGDQLILLRILTMPKNVLHELLHGLGIHDANNNFSVLNSYNIFVKELISYNSYATQNAKITQNLMNNITDQYYNNTSYAAISLLQLDEQDFFDYVYKCTNTTHIFTNKELHRKFANTMKIKYDELTNEKIILGIANKWFDNIFYENNKSAKNLDNFIKLAQQHNIPTKTIYIWNPYKNGNLCIIMYSEGNLWVVTFKADLQQYNELWINRSDAFKYYDVNNYECAIQVFKQNKQLTVMIPDANNGKSNNKLEQHIFGCQVVPIYKSFYKTFYRCDDFFGTNFLRSSLCKYSHNCVTILLLHNIDEIITEKPNIFSWIDAVYYPQICEAYNSKYGCITPLLEDIFAASDNEYKIDPIVTYLSANDMALDCIKFICPLSANVMSVIIKTIYGIHNPKYLKYFTHSAIDYLDMILPLIQCCNSNPIYDIYIQKIHNNVIDNMVIKNYDNILEIINFLVVTGASNILVLDKLIDMYHTQPQILAYIFDINILSIFTIDKAIYKTFAKYELIEYITKYEWFDMQFYKINVIMYGTNDNIIKKLLDESKEIQLQLTLDEYTTICRKLSGELLIVLLQHYAEKNIIINFS